MSNKAATAAILSTMVIIFVICSAVAGAANITFTSGTLESNGWIIDNGIFNGSFGTGIYTTVTGNAEIYSRALYPIALNSSDPSFTCNYTFKLNNMDSRIWMGVGCYPNGSDIHDRTLQRVAGYSGYLNEFSWTTSSDTFYNITPSQVPQDNQWYKAIVSSQDGINFTFTIVNDSTGQIVAGPQLVQGPGTPATDLVIQINNMNNITGGTTTSPILTKVEFTGDAAYSPTPAPSPSPSPAPGGNPYTIALTKGWNLISVPLVPDDTNIADFFPASVINDIEVVWAWDQASQSYQFYTPLPGYNSTLHSINDQSGYWVYADNPITFNVTGTTPQDSSVTVGSGWNLVGNPTLSSRDPASVYSGYPVVWGWDRDTQSYQFYTPQPGYASTLKSLTPGNGYWVYNG